MSREPSVGEIQGPVLRQEVILGSVSDQEIFSGPSDKEFAREIVPRQIQADQKEVFPGPAALKSLFPGPPVEKEKKSSPIRVQEFFPGHTAEKPQGQNIVEVDMMGLDKESRLVLGPLVIHEECSELNGCGTNMLCSDINKKEESLPNAHLEGKSGQMDSNISHSEDLCRGGSTNAVPTLTTPTLTPTTLRNIEQMFAESDVSLRPYQHENAAGFVPPIVSPTSGHVYFPSNSSSDVTVKREIDDIISASGSVFSRPLSFPKIPTLTFSSAPENLSRPRSLSISAVGENLSRPRSLAIYSNGENLSLPRSLTSSSKGENLSLPRSTSISSIGENLSLHRSTAISSVGENLSLPRSLATSSIPENLSRPRTLSISSVCENLSRPGSLAISLLEEPTPRPASRTLNRPTSLTIPSPQNIFQFREQRGLGEQATPENLTVSRKQLLSVPKPTTRPSPTKPFSSLLSPRLPTMPMLSPRLPTMPHLSPRLSTIPLLSPRISLPSPVSTCPTLPSPSSGLPAKNIEFLEKILKLAGVSSPMLNTPTVPPISPAFESKPIAISPPRSPSPPGLPPLFTDPDDPAENGKSPPPYRRISGGSDHSGHMEDDDKKLLRRERNKLAAARCRKRRTDLTMTLQDEVLNWEQKVRGLKEELMELETQKLGLESVLNRHAGPCKVRRKS